MKHKYREYINEALSLRERWNLSKAELEEKVKLRKLFNVELNKNHNHSFIHYLRDNKVILESVMRRIERSFTFAKEDLVKNVTRSIRENGKIEYQVIQQQIGLNQRLQLPDLRVNKYTPSNHVPVVNPEKRASLEAKKVELEKQIGFGEIHVHNLQLARKELKNAEEALQNFVSKRVLNDSYLIHVRELEANVKEAKVKVAKVNNIFNAYPELNSLHRQLRQVNNDLEAINRVNFHHIRDANVFERSRIGEVEQNTAPTKEIGVKREVKQNFLLKI
jgi:hypothetical protein